MSSAFPEDLDTEFEEAYDDAEYDGNEAYDDAESSRARRMRAQRLAAAKQRRVPARRVSALPATAPPRAVVSAVKQLDLQTQVTQDTLRAAIAAQNKRLERTNFVTVAALLIGEGFRTFGEPDNRFLRVGIQAAPLAMLASGSNRRGVEGVIRHPAVYGGAAAMGLAFIGQQRQRTSAVKSINPIGPAKLTPDQQDVFLADVLDGSGKPANVAPTWKSEPEEVVHIDSASGRVKAGKNPGVAVITVTAGDVSHRFRLEVVAAPAAVT